jgi:hypothetical protein
MTVGKRIPAYFSIVVETITRGLAGLLGHMMRDLPERMQAPKTRGERRASQGGRVGRESET